MHSAPMQVQHPDPAERRDPFFNLRGAGLALLVLGILTALSYWPGLHGPWLFDDAANLNVVERWQAGLIGWREVILTNHSGPGGRPLAMASFVLSAALGGYTPFAFKLGNLALHLTNGILVFLVLRHLARRDTLLSAWPLSAPLAVTALWMLHPLLVSTTLYAVQRMAMLSATFVLLALLAYLHGRDHLENGHLRKAALWMFAGMPLATLAAFFSKETGLLAPLMCGVLELVYFSPRAGVSRALPARAFLWLGIALPCGIALVLLAVKPEYVVGGYANRSFTLQERAFTELRVLWDYVGSILAPWGPRLSLFRDDYPLSTSLLAPASTAAALLGWLATIAMAIAWRHRIPAIAAGVGLFLVGHLLESTVFPLLIYFEHRNYLPAVGILWAVAGLAAWAGKRAASHMHRPRQVFGAAILLLVFAMAVATHARALVWQDLGNMLALSLRHHPHSDWLRLNIAQFAMEHRPPRPDIARQHLLHLLRSPRTGARQMGMMNLTALDCTVARRVPGDRADALFAFPSQPIEADLAKAIDNASTVVRTTTCAGLSPAQMARSLDRWLDQSTLPEGNVAKSRLRYVASTLFAAAGLPRESLEQAEIAWRSGRTELPVGGLRVAALIALNEDQQALDLLDELDARPEAAGVQAREFLQGYRALLDEAPDIHTSAPAEVSEQAETQTETR